MKFRIRILGAVGALALLIIAPAAQAQQNVLFTGSLAKLGPFGTGNPFGTVTDQIAQLTGATANPGFTVPQNVLAANFSYTAAFTGYPYFAAYVTRQNLKWSVMPGGFSPAGGTSTIDNSTNNTIYPMLSLSPRTGFIRMKAGPNNFGGPMPSRRASNWVGIKAATVGLYDFYNEFSSTNCTAHMSVGSPPIPGGNCIVYGLSQGQQLVDSFSSIIHQTLTGMTIGQVWGVSGGIGITGTVTVSNPAGNASFFVSSAMDNRNAAGTTGTIQLIHPKVVYGYRMTPGSGVPPRDGTAQFSNLQSGLAQGIKATLTFTPEPGQGLLLAAGILGLAGLYSTTRRTTRRR